MKQPNLIKALIVAASLAGIGLGTAMAQEQLKTQDQLRTQDKDMIKDKDMDKDQDRMRDQDRLHIYGYELMTDQERNAQRERMRAAKTLQERDRIRAEHRAQMDARAKERGVAIIHRDGGATGSSGSSGAGTGAGGKK
ncbi:hypothetical protein [Hydrogenophaga sp.]|jgi:hypothetical protein|uniref:hypothetical protein n=1 Tax=Hydrogenophaga sp. TaxID=1904254 RepID=UPI0025BD2799|nr:hypothetical protein [Hydrogenophaga sp.]